VVVDGDERQRDPGDGQTTERGRDVALDLALGVVLSAGVLAARLTRVTVLRPLTAVAAGALQLGGRIVPNGPRRPFVADLAFLGEQGRAELEQTATVVLRRILRRAVETVLTALDVTELVRAHVDLDALAATLDVDAVIAVVDLDAALDRLDLDAVLSRVDLDAVLSRVDLDAVMGRVDLGAVLSRVDLDAVMSRVDLGAVLSRVDLDAVMGRVDLGAVLSRVDLDAVMGRVDLDAVLSRVDLNEVASRIDIDAILQRVEPDAVVARVDLDAVVDRLDLAALSRQVIEAIDLPEILRQSSGAVSSQAARVVRAEGMNADDSVARFVDRVLRRSHPVTP
jgi:hypothetical protein